MHENDLNTRVEVLLDHLLRAKIEFAYSGIIEVTCLFFTAAARVERVVGNSQIVQTKNSTRVKPTSLAKGVLFKVVDMESIAVQTMTPPVGTGHVAVVNLSLSLLIFTGNGGPGVVAFATAWDRTTLPMAIGLCLAPSHCQPEQCQRSGLIAALLLQFTQFQSCDARLVLCTPIPHCCTLVPPCKSYLS